MRENYTSFSSMEHAKIGYATLGTGSSPGGGLVLERTHERASLKNVFSSEKHLSSKLGSKLALMVGMLFLLLTHTTASAQCTAAPAIVGVGDLTAASAVLNWNTVSGVTGGTYTVDVATDSGFASIVATATGVTTTRYQTVGLTENATYYFRVKVDNTTCGDYSTATSFVPRRGTYTPLTTSGYTADVIANGTGSPTASSGAAVDNGNFVYCAMDYRPTASNAFPVTNSGLPVNRVITTGISGMSFFMQDYSTNNSLRLPTNATNGTITLAYPQKFSTIYVVVTSGSGAATLQPTLNFTDGTSYTGTAATTLINWDGTASAAVPATSNAASLNRIDRTNATAAAPTGTGSFRLYYFTISVPVAYQTKLINSINFTKNGVAAAVAQIFGLSGKTLEACPLISSVSSTATSTTSFTANWVLGGLAEDGATPTYTLEVYTDSGYTTPVAGSPFTGLTGTSYSITGLPGDVTYYYRVKANGTSCSSAYVTGTQSLAYCSPTTSTTYYVTNFTTVGGATNINNTTGASSTNYSATQSVSVQAGSTFTYTGTKAAGNMATGIFVDWNNDLDFDDSNETIFIHTGLTAQGFTAFSGTITIPAGTTLGNHRLRVRTIITGSTPTGCSTSAGEFEDYALNVTAASGACTAPSAPASIAFSAISSSNITATVTASSSAPTGYVVVRSLSSSLSASPVSGTSYAVGATLGGGTVVAVSTAAPTVTSFVSANTGYYFYVYAFNNGSCVGPVYSSTAATGSATSCATVAVSSAASNVKNSFATLNWVSLKGTNGNPVTYTVELYSDSGLTSLVGSYPVVDQTSYDVTDLVANTTYYYRVKAEVPTGCGNTAYSATINFKAENNYSPINLTGFNADVIAEGNGWATISTTSDVDGGGYVYMSRDYVPNAASTALTTGALPVNRTMASPNNSGLNFLMPDYKQNNVVRLTAAAPSQDLVFAIPTKLTNIYLAVTSGGGASSITGTIYFTDGTTQVIGTTAVLDWFSAPTTALPALAFNIGRVNKNGTNYEAEFTSTTTSTGSNAKIFQLSIDILAANQAKKVSRVTVTRAASSSGLPNIFAISGKVIGDCPTLTSASAVAASSTSATVSWVLGAEGDGGAPTYTIQTYSDSGYTTLVSTNTGATGTSFTVPGLSPFTTYYFRVTAVNSVCSSNIVTASATTLQAECVTPGTPSFTTTTTTSTGVTGTIGAPTPSAVGYVVVRSISSSLGAAPTNFTTYTVGTAIGSGNVISVGTSTAVNDTTGASNTHYYYYIYAYNSGTSCSGPIYSALAATADATTCVGQALVVGASNIRNSSATINWTSVTGGGASAVTYNLEVYTNSSYTTLFNSYTGLTAAKQSVEGLTANATYYYRVQAASSGSCSSTYATGSFVATNGFTPIDVTSGGYNQDVIANGTGAAQYSTTAPVDATGAGNAYVARNYIDGNGVATTVGLPVNRFLSSSTTSGLNFIVPDYSGNNSLRLPAQNDTGTLTFETPVKLTDLYIATTGGSGELTASAEIIFSDGGTSQTTANIAIPDWVTGTGSVIVNNLGRANRTNTTGGVETLASKIFQVAIPINLANQSRKVAAVKFTKTSGGATEPVLNIFAISGKIIGDCPSMASTSLTSSAADGAAITWVLGAEGDGGTPTYTVEVFTDAAFTASAGTPVTGLTGTSYAISGLSAQTTYYYRVKATNSACESGYVTGTFTTSQVPATLNWTADFEGTTYWTLVNGTQTNKWVIGSATASAGTKSLYVSNDNGTTNGYDVNSASTVQAYRDIAIPAGTTNVEFSFDWRANGEGSSVRYDYLRVWMVPTTYVPTAGTQVGSGSGNIQIGGYFNLQTTYTTYYTPTLDVSSFAGQNVRLVFEWTNDGSLGTTPSASIDNVHMGIPTCLTPSNLAAVSTLTSANVSWTAPNTAPSNGYEHYYSTVNTAPVAATAGTAVPTGTSANIASLPTATTYYFWVRSVCDAGDKSAWVSGGSFYTGYCTPTYSSCDSTHRITLVTVTETAFSDDLSAVTACSTAATNRTSTQIAVISGSTYTFNASSIGFESVGLAIDFNSNANFADAGEIIALPAYQAGNPQVYTMSVAIPAGTAPGSYRLRIWNREANAGAGTNPCGSYAYGTYVDYTLVVSAPCFTWTGAASTNWAATANWCGGLVPTTSSDVIIAATSNNPVISTGTAYTHNLTIAEGATLTVATGATLDVENILSVNPLGTLIVQNNGALIQGVATATNSNTGNIVFHKKGSSLYRLDYTLWSSPVAGQDLADFSPATASNRFYEYKTPTDVYGGVTAAGTDFETAKAYLIRMPNADAADGYNTGVNPIQFDGTFTGQPGNGTITKALSAQGNLYNAVGNPYPSPINLHDFLFANSSVIDGASGVYLWRKKNDGASSSYATLTLAAFTANPATGGGSVNNEFYEFDQTTGSDNWLLAPGQGFIVKGLTGATNPVLTFTNEMRRATPGSSQSFFRQTADRASRLWLNLNAVATGSSAQTAIAYMDQATLALDYGYDAKKFAESNTVALYSLAENTPLAVQARPAFTDADVVPMGFIAPTAGSYTVSIDHVNGGFSNGQAIYIRDNAEGIVRNLNEGSYTFATEAGTFNGRFDMLYNTVALGTDNPVLDANAVAVFKQGNTIQINTGSVTMNGVTIYDIRGRKVYSMDNVNNTQAAITNLAAEQQVLIVEVNTVKGKVSKRIVF